MLKAWSKLVCPFWVIFIAPCKDGHSKFRLTTFFNESIVQREKKDIKTWEHEDMKTWRY